MILNLKNDILELVDRIKDHKIEIYNEASIQYEFAILLRERYPKLKIQLERNISYFGFDKNKFVKKEIDIIIFNEDKSKKTAIEIKFPTNGQYPEQMFSFCKDIKFLEQLKSNGFSKNVFLAFANDHNFWNSNLDEGTIYQMFRNQKKIMGHVQKPTGKKDDYVEIQGEYDIDWISINSEIKFFEIQI